MEKAVVQYQRVFNRTIDRLKANDHVLAVMVFGSMVTGDLWDESDIDFFVITKEYPETLKNIYTDEKGISVHIKIMNKEKFLQLHESDLKGGFIHRIFASSRLVFSRDMELTNRYNSGRYYPDVDRERWNMVYLGRVLKNISLCRKYLSGGKILTAYSICVSCIEEYSRLYVNFSGHMISKDAIATAMNLNNNFKSCVEDLFCNNGEMEDLIRKTIDFINGEIDQNIKNIARLLIESMEKCQGMASSEDIKNDKLYESYDIEMEEILKELWKKNIIKKGSRDYNLSNGKTVIQENVYYI
ncbi:MAG: nucleotidyltransferase domain-containing protein [Bacillota bacterium]|nr:nucleotidyltransferase domain-containing protein [Bacillota bacterium]